MFKKGLFLVLFIILFTTNVYGNMNNTNLLKLYFFQNPVLEESNKGESLFLFSYGRYTNEKEGDIYLFLSNLEVDAEIDGDIYSFFSNVNIKNKASINNIKTISSSVTYRKDVKIDSIDSYFKFIRVFQKQTNNNNYITFSDKIPKIIIIAFMVFVKSFICFTTFSIKKEFFMQGSAAVKKQKLEIFKYGVISYVVVVALVSVFIISLVGMPVALLIFFIFYGFLLGGQSSLGLLAGHKIFELLKVNTSVYFKLIVGVALFETVSYIPYSVYFVKFVIFPITYIGVFISAFINVYIRKVYYELPDNLEYVQKIFNHDDIRGIVLKDIQKKEGEL